jgi:hypothetical protein
MNMDQIEALEDFIKMLILDHGSEHVEDAINVNYARDYLYWSFDESRKPEVT